jgi:hypothetical protein
MVLTPALRGLFGVNVDALANTIAVDPHLPAQWQGAKLRAVRVGRNSVDLTFAREGSEMVVTLSGGDLSGVKLTSSTPGARVAVGGREARIPLPAVEVGMAYGADGALPLPGSATAMPKVLGEERGARTLTLALEAQGGTTQRFFVRRNAPAARPAVEGASLRGDTLVVAFPAGEGYRRRTVVLRW